MKHTSNLIMILYVRIIIKKHVKNNVKIIIISHYKEKINQNVFVKIHLKRLQNMESLNVLIKVQNGVITYTKIIMIL